MDNGGAHLRALDHTADVGFEVVADGLEALFAAVARGMFALIEGSEEEPGPDVPTEDGTTVELSCTGDELASLVVAWLRELLWLHHDRGLVFRQAEYLWLDERALRARVTLAPGTRAPVREIKGVTYHDLVARKTDGGFHARIIFDV